MKLLLSLLLISTLSIAQKNLTFRSQLTYSVNLNDVWGYTDSVGNEYALVGTKTALSIVDVTNPDSIKELFSIPGANSTWRDIKTWKNYCYVTNETGGGLLIADLSQLPDTVFYNYWSGGSSVRHKSAHNIWIDENGFAYIFGFQDSLNTYTKQQRGAMILNLNIDPANPSQVGLYTNAYLHDGFVRGDTLWGAEIYYGQFSAVDVSVKNNPLILATQPTPNTFTHNVWTSDDNKYVFTTDETSNAFVGAYDVSDLNNIFETDRYQSNPGSGVIPHNTHFFNKYIITSYYRDGVTIADVSNPKNIIETGNYDTSPLSGNGYNGCWGAYPFLPSGNILASDIENGLFVLTPNYVRACYLEGVVTNALSGDSLDSAIVLILPDSTFGTSKGGYYKTGVADSGIYSIRFSATGYYTREINGIKLNNGIITILNVALIPDSVDLNCNAKAGFAISDSIICQGDTLIFSNTSDSAYLFTWYYNGFYYSSDTNIIKYFADTGFYNLKLITDDGICIDSSEINIRVNINPTAYFTHIDSTAKIFFSDSSENTIEWFWEFGDGNTDSIQNPVHLYSDSGAFVVCLAAINNQCRSSYCDTIGINCNLAKSNFSYIQKDLEVNFNASLSKGESFKWDFGDGNYDTTQFPVYTFADSGGYNVCLTAFNSCGNDTSCELIQVYCNPPIADFAYADSLLTLTFTNNSLYAESYLWDFGDGNIDTASSNVVHQYKKGGLYKVCLYAFNSCDSDTICYTIPVKTMLNYHPVLGKTNQWNVMRVGEIIYTDQITTRGDTLINNTRYKIFGDINYAPYNGYLREDTLTSQIFFLPSTPSDTNNFREYLIYDFSLTTGDSIFLYNTYYTKDSSWFKVDSVGEYYTRVGKRKVLFLSGIIDKVYNMKSNPIWIEGVGNLSTFQYSYMEKDLFNFGELLCSYIDSSIVYHVKEYSIQIDSVYIIDSCMVSFGSGILEFEQSTIKVYPNPNNGKIYIEPNQPIHKKTSICLFNILGERVFWKEYDSISIVEIELSGFIDGIYFLNLNYGNNFFSKKIVVMK